MAAGKTTVGRLLAERLGWRFVDLDDLISETEGRSPGALIRDEGEAAFRALERDFTRSFAGVRGVVLAPGGGWTLDPANAAALGPGTVRVWLRISAAEAVRRALAEGVDRPLLGPEGANAPRLERAEALLAERTPVYSTAEIAVDGAREPEEVADAVVRHLEAYSGGR